MSHLFFGLAMLLLQAQPSALPPAPAVCPNVDSVVAVPVSARPPLPRKGFFFLSRTWTGAKAEMWLSLKGQKPQRATCFLECTEYCFELANAYCRQYCAPNDYDCLQQCNAVQAQCNCDNHCCDDGVGCPP
jgi:hypothetical protein